MVQKQVPSVIPTARARRGPSVEPTLPSSPPRDLRLEDYLDRVMAPLVERVPYLERQRIRAEMAEHLDALVAAHAELETGEDPVLAALERFGTAKDVARSWRTSWAVSSVAGAREAVPPGTFRDSVVLAAKLFGAAALPLWAVVIASSFGVQIEGDGPAFLGVGLVVLAPAAAGLLVGFNARKRPTLACLVAVAGMIVLGHMLAAFASEPLLQAFLEDRGVPASRLSQELSAVPMVQSYVWLGIGAAGSALALWSRTRIAAFRELVARMV